MWSNYPRWQFFKHSGRMKAERPTSVIIQRPAVTIVWRCFLVRPRVVSGLAMVVDGRTNVMQIGRALKRLDRTAASIATSQDRQVIERIGYTPTMHR